MTGIETQLKTISGLRTQPFRPDQINPPQAYVSLPAIPSYHEAFHHGVLTLNFVITLIISKALDRIGEPIMATYASPTGTNSIHAAIELDRTLGLSANGVDAIVIDFREADLNFGGNPYYGGVFTVRVTAPGT